MHGVLVIVKLGDDAALNS